MIDPSYWHHLLLLSSLGIVVTLLILEKVGSDVGAVFLLLFLTLTGYLSPKEAVSGFSSPTIIVLGSMFFLSIGLRETGVADKVGALLERWAGRSETRAVFALCLATALFSSVIPNMSATALMLPVAMHVAAHIDISPSRVLLPVAFSAMLGGMLTLIGTQPNIIAADLLQRMGEKPFHFFDFTPFGLAAVVLGVPFLAFRGRKYLPQATSARGRGSTVLADLYRLQERLLTVKIPSGCALEGHTLAAVEFGETLGARVLAIVHRGRKKFLPGAHDILHGEDLLLVGGRREDLESLRRFEGINVASFDQETLTRLASKIEARRLRVKDGSLVGLTLREVRFAGAEGVLVVEILRRDRTVFSNVAGLRLEVGDELLVLVPRRHEPAHFHEDVDIVDGEAPLAEALARHFFSVVLPESSPLQGVSLRESRLGELFGVTAVGLERDGELRVDFDADDILKAGDHLLVSGEAGRMKKLSRLGELRIVDEGSAASTLESSEVTMVEVVLPPRSALIGKTLVELNFRERYGFQVLAIWREGMPRRSRLAQIRLQLGDALLLQVPTVKLKILSADPDFVVLTETLHVPRRTERAWVAIGAFVTLLFLAITQIQPVEIAALIGALIMVLGGAVQMEEVYRSIEWRIVVLIAALLPLGSAFHQAGTDALIASGISYMVQGKSPYLALTILALASSAVSEALDSSIAVVLLAPIAHRVSEQLGLSIYPFMMIVALSASIAFLTPFSSKSALLVMGAGGYRSRDYFRIGSYLSIILFVTFVILTPLIFPFRP